MSAPRLVGLALVGARAAAGSSPWRRSWPSPELAAATGNPDARALNRPSCVHDGHVTANGICLECGLALPKRALHGVDVPIAASHPECQHKCRRDARGCCMNCGKYIVVVLSMEDIRRFWQRVDRDSGPNECWNWTGHIGTHGYGLMWIGRRPDRKFGRANRISWAIANGGWPPEGMFVCHQPTICHNRACVNPAHLYLGTPAENSADKKADGTEHESNVTHCPYGHEYTPENTYITNRGSRACKQCWRRPDRRVMAHRAAHGRMIVR